MPKKPKSAETNAASKKKKPRTGDGPKHKPARKIKKQAGTFDPKAAAEGRPAFRRIDSETVQAADALPGAPAGHTVTEPDEATIAENMAALPSEPKPKKRAKAAAPPEPEARQEAGAEAVAYGNDEREGEPEGAGAARADGFDGLGLDEPVVRAINALGFETPTPIQARAIPVLLTGRDMIGQAQTGTGKTAAFALPMIQHIDAARNETQALVLAPTRELAVQVAGGIYDLAKHTGLRVVPVYGGQPIDRQFRALRSGAHIVVGTPGRVLDHLRRGSLTLEKVTFCTLDEADEMLALGFLEDMETILAELPEERQLAFFSATMPPRIAQLTKRFLKNPEHIAIEAKQRTVDAIEQTWYDVPRGKKMEALARVLDMETPGPTIVFCRTRQETNDLSEQLRLRGYNAEALNGEMSQADRDRVLRRFKEGQADLLVATDVAARGLDIDTVTHVINYDIPWDVEQYIHRIGRTGRAGRSGDAITLVEGRERRQLKIIEKMIGAAIKPARIPTAADIAGRRRDLFVQSLRDMLNDGDFETHLATVDELSEEFSPAEIAAAALQLLWQYRHSEAAEAADDLALDVEQPEFGMARVFVSMGRQDGLRPADIVVTIARASGLSGKSIGAIDILDRSTFVEVPMAHAEDVVEALNRSRLRGKKVRSELAGEAKAKRR